MNRTQGKRTCEPLTWDTRKQDTGEEDMTKVTFEGDDFKRMKRAEMTEVNKLVEAKKFGKHKVKSGEKTITIEIVKKETGIVVKRLRVN